MSTETRPPEASSPRTMGWLAELVRNWGPAILAVLVIRTFIFEPFRIPSGSMVPTLLIGDHVFVTKFSYGVWIPFGGPEILDLGDPERGDVIVFRYPLNTKLNYIKRVVGIPGDHIRVVDNQIFLNGQPQERTYEDRYDFVDDMCRSHRTKRYTEDLDGLEHVVLTNVGAGSHLATSPPLGSPRGDEWVVPKDHVFVMGDNRDNSEDSRAWEFVPFHNIKGKAQFVWLSWNGCAESPNWIRMDRLFHSLY